MFVRKAGTYPSGVPKGSSLYSYALGLIHKHLTRLERLVRDKHSSFLRTFVNYGHKFFITLGTGLVLQLLVTDKLQNC
jgi:hypothetical protein